MRQSQSDTDHDCRHKSHRKADAGNHQNQSPPFFFRWHSKAFIIVAGRIFADFQDFGHRFQVAGGSKLRHCFGTPTASCRIHATSTARTIAFSFYQKMQRKKSFSIKRKLTSKEIPKGVMNILMECKNFFHWMATLASLSSNVLTYFLTAVSRV